MFLTVPRPQYTVGAQESHPALTDMRPVLWGAMFPLGVFPRTRRESKREGLGQGGRKTGLIPELPL